MAIIRRAILSVQGLRPELDALQQAINAASSGAGSALTDLQNSLTTMINNNKSAIETTVAALDAAAAKKAANLSDLTDAAAARSNISVPSIAEVNAAIDAAKVALGTNFTVADNAARDALTGLDTADRVTVTNGGAWITYGVESVTNGVATFYVMTSKEEWEAANSAAAIKTAYESNADTNAYTDAEQAKVGYLSVTSAIDLDKVVQNDELVGSAALLAGSGTGTQIASAAAVQSFVAESVRTGGTKFKSEMRLVDANKIVLSFAPKDGMIFNFGTVRFIDTDGTASDIQVVVDSGDLSGKTYTMAGDSTGQFDGKQVAVQYPYVEPAV